MKSTDILTVRATFTPWHVNNLLSQSERRIPTNIAFRAALAPALELIDIRLHHCVRVPFHRQAGDTTATAHFVGKLCKFVEEQAKT